MTADETVTISRLEYNRLKVVDRLLHDEAFKQRIKLVYELLFKRPQPSVSEAEHVAKVEQLLEKHLFSSDTHIPDDTFDELKQNKARTHSDIQEFNKRRVFGSGAHLIKYVADDFDEPLEEFEPYT